MNGNPYYVNPQLDFSEGLQGLAQTMMQSGQIKEQKRLQEEAARQTAEIRQKAVEAYRSGDLDRVAEFSLAYPEMGEAMRKAMDFDSKRTEEDYINSMFEFLQDPSRAEELITDRQAFLRSQGVGPDKSRETDTFIERLNKDPEGMRKNIEFELAFRAPEKHAAYKKAMEGQSGKAPSTAMAAFLKQHPEATPDEIIAFSQKLKASEAGQGMTTAQRTKEAEIQRYIDEGIAIDRKEAIKLAEKLYRLGQDSLGNSVIIDMSDGSVVRPLEQDGTERPEVPKERKPFMTVEEVEQGIGPWASTKQIINNVVGGFVSGQVFEDTETARHKIAVFNQKGRDHLKVSSRGAAFDITNINKILPDPDKFFQDPDAAKGKLQNLYTLVRSTIDEKNRIIADETITKKQKQELIGDVNSLYEFLSYLPDAESLFQATPGFNFNDMSAEEIYDIDLGELSEEQKQQLNRRLDELLSENRK